MGTEDDIKPTTLRSYIIGLQRALHCAWGYNFNFLSGPVFGDENNGLVTVIDNKIRKQQANGVAPESHNVLSKEDIFRLYSSQALSKDTPKGYLTRMIFNIAFMTSFRPTELSSIRIQDVTKMAFGQEDAWRIVGRIGCMEGSSKTQGGGLRFVNVKPKEMFVWNRPQLNGKVNVYKDIEEYISLTERHRDKKENFFLAINYFRAGGERKDFFKPVNLGKNTFIQYIQAACASVGIVGTGVRKNITMHGLRGTVITQLFEAGHADSSVALRSGQRSMTAMKSYQNLRGDLGKRQQQDILSDFSSTERDRKIQKSDQHYSNDCKLKEEDNRNPNAEGEFYSNANGVRNQSLNNDRLGFLSNVGSVSGAITVNLNYFGACQTEEVEMSKKK